MNKRTTKNVVVGRKFLLNQIDKGAKDLDEFFESFPLKRERPSKLKGTPEELAEREDQLLLKVTKLDLSVCYLSDSSFDAAPISMLESLVELDLSRNNLTTLKFSIPTLKYLSLEDNDLKSLGFLKNFPALLEITLSGNRNIERDPGYRLKAVDLSSTLQKINERYVDTLRSQAHGLQLNPVRIAAQARNLFKEKMRANPPPPPNVLKKMISERIEKDFVEAEGKFRGDHPRPAQELAERRAYVTWKAYKEAAELIAIDQAMKDVKEEQQKIKEQLLESQPYEEFSENNFKLQLCQRCCSCYCGCSGATDVGLSLRDRLKFYGLTLPKLMEYYHEVYSRKDSMDPSRTPLGLDLPNRGFSSYSSSSSSSYSSSSPALEAEAAAEFRRRKLRLLHYRAAAMEDDGRGVFTINRMEGEDKVHAAGPQVIHISSDSHLKSFFDQVREAGWKSTEVQPYEKPRPTRSIIEISKPIPPGVPVVFEVPVEVRKSTESLREGSSRGRPSSSREDHRSHRDYRYGGDERHHDRREEGRRNVDHKEEEEQDEYYAKTRSNRSGRETRGQRRHRLRMQEAERNRARAAQPASSVTRWPVQREGHHAVTVVNASPSSSPSPTPPKRKLKPYATKPPPLAFPPPQRQPPTTTMTATSIQQPSQEEEEEEVIYLPLGPSKTTTDQVAPPPLVTVKSEPIKAPLILFGTVIRPPSHPPTPTPTPAPVQPPPHTSASTMIERVVTGPPARLSSAQSLKESTTTTTATSTALHMPPTITSTCVPGYPEEVETQGRRKRKGQKPVRYGRAREKDILLEEARKEYKEKQLLDYLGMLRDLAFVDVDSGVVTFTGSPTGKFLSDKKQQIRWDPPGILDCECMDDTDQNSSSIIKKEVRFQDLTSAGISKLFDLAKRNSDKRKS